MSDSPPGGGERTEPATPKRMKELRRDGSLQRSQDLSAWLGVGFGSLMLPFVLGGAQDAARNQVAMLQRAVEAPEPALAIEALGVGLGSVLLTLAPLMAVVVLAAIGAAASQGGLHIHTKKLKPTFKQFNVIKGFKKVFGPEAWWNGAKAALKAFAIGAVFWVVIQGMVPVLLGSGRLPLSQLLTTASSGATNVLRAGVAAGLLLAIMDVLVVMKRNRKKNRMTRYEVQQENKQTEGDPWVKGARRSKQIQMSRNRMIADVATADVVLVNPTHVAVALRYEPGTGAPKVVAKGSGHVASRIRAVASEKRVPMVEDVPLARALHAACELGQEIPPHLYTAVARILAFVMALRRRGSGTGTHRAPGGPSEIPEAVAA